MDKEQEEKESDQPIHYSIPNLRKRKLTDEEWLEECNKIIERVRKNKEWE